MGVRSIAWAIVLSGACNGSGASDRDAGTCPSCTGTTPICGDDQTCRACIAHGECPSSACLPSGECADQADVAYVAPAGAGTACTLAEPCETLNDALGTNRGIAKIATGVVDDAALTTIDGRTLTILADPGAKLAREGNGTVLDIRGASTDVSIYDLEITGATNSGGDNDGIKVYEAKLSLTRARATNCDGNGIYTLDADVTISQSTFSGNKGSGIAFVGGKMHLERSTITGNARIGTFMGVMGVVTITNNFMVRNGGSGLTLRPTGVSRVELNTIVDNTDGVVCDVTGFVAPNNLIFRNATQQTMGTCTYGNSFVMAGADPADNTPAFVEPNNPPHDYHLTAASPTTIVDAAGTCSDVDFDGDDRPVGVGCDLGADEYRP